MDSALLISLSKAIDKQCKDADVQPGEYFIDQAFSVRIRGVLTRAEDTTYTPTADIPLLPTLALFAKRTGFQRDYLLSVLKDVMTEVVNNGTNAVDGLTEYLGDIDHAMVEVKKAIRDIPKKSRKGATKGVFETTLEIIPA